MTKRAIPLVGPDEQMRTAERADKIRLLITTHKWTFEETLRAFSGVVFWSGGKKRKRAIAWLEELLRDLVDTMLHVPPEATNDVWGDDPS